MIEKLKVRQNARFNDGDVYRVIAKLNEVIDAVNENADGVEDGEDKKNATTKKSTTTRKAGNTKG